MPASLGDTIKLDTALKVHMGLIKLDTALTVHMGPSKLDTALKVHLGKPDVYLDTNNLNTALQIDRGTIQARKSKKGYKGRGRNQQPKVARMDWCKGTILTLTRSRLALSPQILTEKKRR